MWLDRFERVDGQLMAVGITQSGSQSLLTPEQMQTSNLGSGGYKAITLDTSFAQWERTSAREYATAFEITSSITDRHGMFSIPYEGGNIGKRLKWAVIDFRAGARDDGGSLGSRDGLLYPKGRSGFGEKAHRYAATFHGSNSSMRLIGWSAMQLSTWHR